MNVYLHSDYRPLKKMTDNFTRDETRINCSKIKYQYCKSSRRLPKHIKDYFVRTWTFKF
jgi:hypothetical protein